MAPTVINRPVRHPTEECLEMPSNEEDQKRSDRKPVHHHSTMREVAPGIWQVAPPLRDSSWWHRLKAEWRCRRDFGHCWHPFGMVDWFCCICGGETDGMPQQRCVYCAEVPTTPDSNGAPLAAFSETDPNEGELTDDH